jgi:hypothetical protein
MIVLSAKHKTFLRDSRQACLPQFAFDLADLLAEVNQRVFQGRHGDVHWMIARRPPLACILTDLKIIAFHELMSHRVVPRFVMEHVFIHELLHLDVPPGKREDGSSWDHPPEFTEAEKALSPRGSEAMSRIWSLWRQYLRVDKKEEGIFVKRTWKHCYLGEWWPLIEEALLREDDEPLPAGGEHL